ncbi:hypothetical protein CBER1_01414 [Cercospora berteroae]|uniref:Uncharacterized protein n=1 Tax=Cercospora berteroae TaxID=357750 RepID=A0A2S6CC99_9PEZI|nr:hypothetical protein CBER1_01414 [Cercospora berteroae]
MVAHISQLTERLKRLHCLIHVRTLRLFGDPRWDEYGFDEYGDHLRGKWERPPYSGDDEDCRLDPPDNIGPGVQLLSQLISLLPGLKDCVYAWDLPIPHDLLEALEARRCRLHFELFQLSDLLRLPHERDKVIGPLDLRLATSPLLHTVKINAYDEYRSGGYFNFHLEGLLDMVKGLAPGLRQVSLLRMEPEYYAVRGQNRWKWQGTELGTLSSGFASRGSLTSLELAGNGSTALKEM